MSDNGLAVTHWPEEMHKLGPQNLGSFQATDTIEGNVHDARIARMVEAFEAGEWFAVQLDEKLGMGSARRAFAKVEDIFEYVDPSKVRLKLQLWWEA